MEDKEIVFVPVAFATLTERNNTGLVKLLDGISEFVWGISKRTKCHIKVLIGYEDGPNSHAHLIIQVPTEDLNKWQQNNHKFRAWEFWRFKTLDFQPWESGHNTFAYVMIKHTPITFLNVKCPPVLLPDVVCPKRTRQCRAGHCQYITK